MTKSHGDFWYFSYLSESPGGNAGNGIFMSICFVKKVCGFASVRDLVLSRLSNKRRLPNKHSLGFFFKKLINVAT